MKLRQRGATDWVRAQEMRRDGATYDSIAKELGCSVSSAYYAVHHEHARSLRAKLREERADAEPRKRTSWSPELVVERFRIYHELTGRVPRDVDLGANGLPDRRTVMVHCGSLSRAQKMSGFKPRKVGRPKAVVA